MLVVAGDEDVPQIVTLMNRAYRGIGAKQGWNSEAGYISGNRTTEDLLRAEIAAKPDASLLMWRDQQDGALKGSVWLEPLGGDAWYLGSLTIDPARQNGGLGHALLSLAEQWIEMHGGTRVRMTVVNIREALIAWYGRRDYQPTGETNPFPYGDDRFGIPLRDDLSFVVLEKPLFPAHDEAAGA
jgi:ribosomal protein S18 acetylase RimI-like enzyme